MQHKFNTYKIKVDQNYIDKCAKKYLQLLSVHSHDLSQIDKNPLFKNLGFSSEKITETIKKYSIPSRDISSKKSDVFRSDFGEILMAAYFEKALSQKFPGEKNFIIPMKNISNRESVDMPARGFDLVGYRKDEKLTLLLGEVKVSDEDKSPPQVVHNSDDSIYKTHLKHRTNKTYLLKKLTTLYKRLNYNHSGSILLAIHFLEEENVDKMNIVYGCCLVRDYKCHTVKDFGKMESNANEFEPGSVNFIIVCLDKAIEETISEFHRKVLELVN